MPRPLRLGHILELWRFPVKSMRGESLTEVSLTSQGLEGDRTFALSSTAAPTGKPLLASAERTAMLLYTARWTPQPTVTAPDGRSFPLPSAALLAALKTTAASPGAEVHLEHSPEDPFFDVRPVSLISQATLQALTEERGQPVNPLRFRSNLVLALRDHQAFAEHKLTSQTLQVGGENGPLIRVLERIPRCRIVSLDPETIEADPTLLRHLAKHHEGRIGVYARVLKPGLLRIGDPVFRAD